MKRGKCILMCAGEFSPIRHPISKNDYVIAVDGGLKYLLRCGIEPNLILGDFDSLTEEEKGYLRRIYREDPERIEQLPVEKDDTDTVAAVRRGLELGYMDYEIYGALGGRLDHIMANVQTLLWLKHQGGDGALFDERTEIRILEQENFIFPDEFSGTFSIFALGEELRKVTLRGTKYEADQVTITNDFPLGISNETLDGVRSEIEILYGAALLIMTDRYKNSHHGILEI